MQLEHGIHLAYCTNIHRGESWVETLANLELHTMAVRELVAPGRPYAIGLRLSDQASRELSEPDVLIAFQRWLEKRDCYVFTINGFPFGPFHGTSVKEQVYMPDWTTRERVEYTKRLFDLLARLVPSGMEGSVSTVPCSFKEFNRSAEQERAMRANLWECVEHLAALSESSGRDLHLGLEPEPLCYLETTSDAVEFFERMRTDRPGDPRLDRHLGINYDACHLAVEFEEPGEALDRLAAAGIRLSKVHLSSALKVRPAPPAREALRSFADATYLHQVVVRCADGELVRYRDLEPVLAARATADKTEEWRIHFHVPLYSPPSELFETTVDHLLGVLDTLAPHPERCRHLEMETYTWEVLPPELKQRGVVDQLIDEYAWTLARLAERGLVLNDKAAPMRPSGG